jgi:hypothetical protein
VSSGLSLDRCRVASEAQKAVIVLTVDRLSIALQ